MLDVTTRIKPVTCPHCRVVHDAASHDTAVPSPGDISVCIMCAGLSTYTANMQLRKLTQRELLELKANLAWLKVQQYQAAIISMHNSRKTD
jgi:hypothetical protein